MASITYWNRLEPRPIGRDLNATLAARLRDPLWLLARQWQVGEFQGEDAGSPAFATISATSRPFTGWTSGDGRWQPLPSDRPLESVLLAEPFAAEDVTLKVELAQMYERELRSQQGATAALADRIVAELRRALPLPAPPSGDHDAAEFLAVCAHRSFDGTVLLAAARMDPPAVPADLHIHADDLPIFQEAARSFARTVRETFGDIGSGDPVAWRPERLDFSAAVAADADNDPGLVLSVAPSPEGTLDWYALDGITPTGDRPAGAVTKVQRSVIPAHVTFRGMPNARWWDFESGETDYGDLRVDRRDVSKLVIMDFMLIHGNDWFVVPFDQAVGTALDIESLSVTDVFGDTVYVPRADGAIDDAGNRWTAFTCAAPAAASGLIPQFVLPPTAGHAMQTSDPLEDVRFFRDDLANVVWGVEHTVQGTSGKPELSHEREIATAPRPGARATAVATPRYEIQTSLPRYWIPFVPVTLDPASGQIALERAAVFDPGTQPPALVLPRGRILKPPVDSYRIREEEVTRAGIRLVRVVCRSRWTDGSTWIWTTRQRRAASGEGSSGMLFDVVR
jgi:hypothetical protein